MNSDCIVIILLDKKAVYIAAGFHRRCCCRTSAGCAHCSTGRNRRCIDHSVAVKQHADTAGNNDLLCGIPFPDDTNVIIPPIHIGVSVQISYICSISGRHIASTPGIEGNTCCTATQDIYSSANVYSRGHCNASIRDIHTPVISDQR